jgi:hypothetical protein
LFEVALAASALLMTIAGTAQVVMSGAAMLDMARKQTIAAQMIHTLIDQARLKDWDTVYSWTLLDPTTVQLNSLSTSNTAAQNSFGYPELLTLKNVAQNFWVERTTGLVGGRSDMVQITFTVTWVSNPASGRTFSRRGTTYFGKNGLTLTYQRP